MIKKRLKPVYLLFLLLPVVYYFLSYTKTAAPVENTQSDDYFYFSARASRPATLSLSNGATNKLITWNLNNYGYKDLEYLGHINDSAELNITINDLNANDTVHFLGFNLYRNNHMVSLYDHFKKHCTLSNALISEDNGSFVIISKQTGKPVVLTLKALSSWEKKDGGHRAGIVIFIFILIFILVLVLAPNARYFGFSLLISLLVMVICSVSDTGRVGQLTVSAGSSLHDAEVFYNQSPFFNPVKKFTSESLSGSFSVPVNFEKNKFLRCDFGVADEIRNVSIKIEYGVFYKNFNCGAMPQGRLVLNDLDWQGEKYKITGNDPYIKLTSVYFVNYLEWILWLGQNSFLLISLSVLLVLLVLQLFFKGIGNLLCRFSLKYSYVTFLLIPLTYFIVIQIWGTEKHTGSSDQVYFSAHTSRPSLITLYNGNDSLSSWMSDSSAYKYFQYTDTLDVNAGFSLKFENLSKNDTVSLLSVNLFHNDHVYSLFDRNESVCKITNTRQTGQNDNDVSVVQKADQAVIAKLLVSDFKNPDKMKGVIESIILCLFFLVFIIAIIYRPEPRYFVISCFVSSAMMLVFYWLCLDLQDQVTLSTSTPVKCAQFYYNDNPSFEATKIVTVDKGTNFFKTNLDLVSNNYLRCDIAENTKKLTGLKICTKTGIIKNIMDFSTISSGRIMMNDLVRHGKDYYVRGGDPFFVLTSAEHIKDIRSQLFLKQRIFILLTILFFLSLILLSKAGPKRNYNLFFFIVIFLVLVSSGMLLRVFTSEGLVLTAEMRYANHRPVFQLDSSDVFVRELDNYLKDQIPGRNNIIVLNNYIEYSVFRQVLNNQNVHFGKDGWMYYIGGVCRENYENRHPLTSDELKKMTDVLIARRNWLKERGIHFYLVFPTMAYAVYEENVGPRLWRYNKISKLEQLLTYLKQHTDLDIIDIHHPLMAAKKDQYADLYYRSNSHWSHYGAYVAYCAMIKKIQKDFPGMRNPLALKDITWINFGNYKPDMFVLTAIEKFMKYKEFMPSNDSLTAATETTYPYYPEFSSPAPAYCFQNKKLEHPSVLMYGDSFGGFLLYYFTYNFSKTYFLYTPLFYPSIIEKEKPDIVIQEMADYTIYKILDKNCPLPEKMDSTQSLPE